MYFFCSILAFRMSNANIGHVVAIEKAIGVMDASEVHHPSIFKLPQNNHSCSSSRLLLG
jgi:hypothetical protein